MVAAPGNTAGGLRWRLPAAALAVCAAAAAAPARSAAGKRASGAPLPFVRLFDTRVASPAAIADAAVERAAGWAAVPEGRTAHRFVGDAVFLNDKLAVVVRRRGRGVEVYSRAARGFRRRALLAPCAAAGDRAAGLESVSVAENRAAAVTLDAIFKTSGGEAASIGLRLTAGVMFLEIRPGKGAGRLFVQDDANCVVVPDFFADDVVFGPDVRGARVGLPAENHFLSLLAGGEAILMCLWKSNSQNADVILAGSGASRRIRGCQVDCLKPASLWVALLEAPGIWHARSAVGRTGGAPVALDWARPFPAKWRCSVFGPDGVARSGDFADARPAGKTAAGGGETAPVCWFEGSRAFVRADPSGWPTSAPAASKRPRRLVVYPIDRSRATPLTQFCPIDVMRNTLGVGVCRYVLEIEGLAGQDPVTVEQVTQWVERQFQRKPDRRQGDALRQRLDRMVRHVRLTQQRIKAYRDFARDLQQRCRRAERGAELAGKLLAIAGDMQRAARQSDGDAAPGAMAERLSSQLVALIGKADAAAQCQKLCAQVRSIGAAQDAALARCRMCVRRVKQRCRTAAAERPEAADFAGRIRRRAEIMLRPK